MRKTFSFLHFWLGDVFRATTACTLSTSERQKVLRTPRALTLLTWKCASRHNGVHFFRHLNFQERSEVGVCTFWLGNVLLATTACTFSSFDPPEPQIIGKTQWIATYLPFRAPASFFFWLSPSLSFSLLDFSSLTLPTSAFPSLHIAESLTSKLRSITKMDDLGAPPFMETPIWWGQDGALGRFCLHRMQRARHVCS